MKRPIREHLELSGGRRFFLASGGWKTIITVGSVGGIVGSFGTWIATHVKP